MDDFKPVSDFEYQRLMQVLNENQNKSFVKRILQPNQYPTLDAGDGKVATHRMAWGESDGRYVVFPTVMLTDGNKLHDFGDQAFTHAIKSGNFIEFDTPDDAEWFSTRYKGAWGGQKNTPPR